MKQTGFSLIEILICVAIIAIVAAIIFPVAANARRSAQIESSLSNLHQMQLALTIYTTDLDSGPVADPGWTPLPSGEYVLHTLLGLPLKVFQSPCGQNLSWEPRPTVVQYEYLPDTGLDSLAAVWPKYQDRLIVFADFNCARHGEPLYSDFVPHRILGVRLSGELLNMYQLGDARHQAWWNPKE